MHRLKHLALLGSMSFAIGLLFAFTPMASSAFAATTNAHAASSNARPGISRNAVTPAAAINGCPPTEQSGSSNTWVQVIQFRLNDLDGAGLATDGSFGAGTKSAVETFQRDFGLGVDGSVGPDTWTALGFCLTGSTDVLDSNGSTNTVCPPTQDEGNDNTWVTAIQDHLNYDYNFGYFGNTPDNFKPFLSSDGDFGSLTENAVVDFQFGTGLGSSGGGVVGQRTWSLLGMCS